MPELPEVETIRQGLVPMIGSAVESVEIRRRDVIDGLAERGDERALLAGATIVALHRHGKQLAIEGDTGRAVVVHLGMSGQLRVELEGAILAPHTHVVWRLSNGNRLTFRDPRRFGGITLCHSLEALRQRWSALGPDAIEITEGGLRAACKGTRRSIKAVLLDQAAVAGIGNIYADEALFLAHVRPTRTARRVNQEQLDSLARSIREILTMAIERGGSTLRDYVRADGRAGSAQDLHRVYGRGGLPCVRCGGDLRKTVIVQRTTVYCPRCQF